MINSSQLVILTQYFDCCCFLHWLQIFHASNWILGVALECFAIIVNCCCKREITYRLKATVLLWTERSWTISKKVSNFQYLYRLINSAIWTYHAIIFKVLKIFNLIFKLKNVIQKIGEIQLIFFCFDRFTIY